MVSGRHLKTVGGEEIANKCGACTDSSVPGTAFFPAV